jgi:hypothetical protein
MSYDFYAHWVASAEGVPEVHVVLSTTGREFSPDLVFRPTEEVVCGVRAAHLAMAHNGEITSETVGDKSLVRIITGKQRAALLML